MIWHLPVGRQVAASARVRRTTRETQTLEDTMASLTGLPDADVITIEAWRDPVVEALGHDPRSLYVETFWLPVLGPTRSTTDTIRP